MGFKDDYLSIRAKHPDRRTGRSTAKALATVSEAMLNPNVPVDIRDNDVPTRQAARYTQVPIINNIIVSLGLECFVINLHDMTLTYELPVLKIVEDK